MNATATASDLQPWFTAARNTYAIVNAQVVPQIQTLLGEAGPAEWGRLSRGAATADGAEAWCVQLTPDLPFSAWLLTGAGAALDDWGVLACSDAPFRDVHQHLRQQLEAQLPRGERIALRWYRPLVLRTLLPLCAPSQLAGFFGPVRAFAFAEAGPARSWRWLRQIGGQLDTQTTTPPRAGA